MSAAPKKQRLDEILLKAKLVTEEHIQQALTRQKANGGKLGSHLMFLRYIDEGGLVKALAMQFNCEGVIVSKLKIPKSVVEMVPAKVAISRNVLPFAYDTKKSVLKIACENPSDEDLINELSFVTKGKDIKLFVSSEMGLQTAIARNYQGKDITLSDSLSLEIPDTATDTGEIDTVEEDSEKKDTKTVKEVLLVTDEEYSGPLLESLFERDGYKVTVIDSADDAIQMIGDKSFHSVFIKDTVPGDYIDLIDRLRKSSPKTIVKYYENASSLLINEHQLEEDSQLFYTNLDLLTAIMASQSKQMVNHSGRVARYVSKLCDKIGLPQREKLQIITAAYIHDLARFYYHDPNDSDVRTQVSKTAKLLQSVNYSPVIIQMLLSMYKDLGGKYTKRLPIEVLGGNILTAVDLFCTSIPPEQKLSLDRFDVVKKKLRELTGRLFLVEISEAFISMIQEDILNTAASGALGQIMILADSPEYLHPVELRLRNESFRVVCETSVESFEEMFDRSEPDILIIISTSKPEKVSGLVTKVNASRAGKVAIPIFVLVREYYSGQLSAILRKGVEDIISLDSNMDILVAKLHRIISELSEKAQREEDFEETSGATGRITNMSLIDILQAMGPGQKTAKIDVTSKDKNQKLEMYLEKGKIVYAEMGNLKGAEAVYEAISWLDGIWTIEPITVDKLPKSNNNLSNDAILMEGCRLLDEKARSGKLIVNP